MSQIGQDGALETDIRTSEVENDCDAVDEVGYIDFGSAD